MSHLTLSLFHLFLPLSQNFFFLPSQKSPICLLLSFGGAVAAQAKKTFLPNPLLFQQKCDVGKGKSHVPPGCIVHGNGTKKPFYPNPKKVKLFTSLSFPSSSFLQSAPLPLCQIRNRFLHPSSQPTQKPVVVSQAQAHTSKNDFKLRGGTTHPEKCNLPSKKLFVKRLS